jgi:tetratricopeptide (TPR) repeat protein
VDIIAKVITALHADEYTELMQFLGKNSRTIKDRMMAELIWKKGVVDGDKLMAKLYQEEKGKLAKSCPKGKDKDAHSDAGDKDKQNAYHNHRKRFLPKLMRFTLLRALEGSEIKGIEAHSYFLFAKIMMEKRLPDVALVFFNKAELRAQQDRNYLLLDHIYNFEMDSGKLDISVDEIMEKWTQNEIKLNSYSKLIRAKAKVSHQLAAAKRLGQVLNADELFDQIQNEFNPTNEEAADPEYMYKLVYMLRMGFVSVKKYDSIEPYILDTYQHLKLEGAFASFYQTEELGFLYMLIQAMYRNHKFEEAREWLPKMSEVIEGREFEKSEFYAKYILLKAGVAAFTGQCDDAIAILEKGLKLGKRRHKEEDLINMQLNLGVYYFFASEYSKAHETLRKITIADSATEDLLGVEWTLKKNMIEMIVLYELGNDDKSFNMVKRLSHKYAEFLNHPVYQRAGIFLQLIEKMMRDANIVTTIAFHEEVKQARLYWTDGKEDIQAITFFCWLKSKMNNLPFYSLLVEQMKVNG